MDGESGGEDRVNQVASDEGLKDILGDLRRGNRLAEKQVVGDEIEVHNPGVCETVLR
jgi:hypothetical protein